MNQDTLTLNVTKEVPPGLYYSLPSTDYPHGAKEFYVSGTAVFDSATESSTLVCGFFPSIDSLKQLRVFRLEDFQRWFRR